jgi:hypothetical protein
VGTADERLGGRELIALRDAVVERLNAMWPRGPVTAKKHRGKWTDKSAKEYEASAPCIVVAYGGAANWESNGDGSCQGLILLSAFCITSDLADGDADDASLALTQRLLLELPGSDFGISGVSGAENVDGVNAYTNRLDDQGINIHEVSWVHTVTLNKLTDEEYAELPEFLRLFTQADPTRGDADVGDEGEFAPQEHMNHVREP